MTTGEGFSCFVSVYLVVDIIEINGATDTSSSARSSNFGSLIKFWIWFDFGIFWLQMEGGGESSTTMWTSSLFNVCGTSLMFVERLPSCCRKSPPFGLISSSSNLAFNALWSLSIDSAELARSRKIYSFFQWFDIFSTKSIFFNFEEFESSIIRLFSPRTLIGSPPMFWLFLLL